MAKKAQLTVKQVEKLVRDAKKEGFAGRKNIGSQLYIDFSNNTQSYLFRFTLNDKQRWYGLGSLADVSLAQARDKVVENRALVLKGINPIHHAKKEAANLKQELDVLEKREKDFKYFATAFIDNKSAEWKNKKTVGRWEYTLETFAYPVIGHLPILEIETHHIEKILKPIWFTKTVTASDTRARIEAVINYGKAILNVRTSENPAFWKGNLEYVFPPESKIHKVKHHPSMDYDELPEFMLELKSKSKTCIAAKALMLTILTVPRTCEVISARASEINDGVWEIPEERMKRDIRHKVPLSRQSIQLINELTAVNDYLFPSPSKRSEEGKAVPISSGAMDALLERMGRKDVTVHGFRATFETYMEEKHDFKENVIDTCLAHLLKDSNKGAYNRANYLEKRVEVMQVWADYCMQYCD